MTSLHSTTQANALTIREKALYYALIPVFVIQLLLAIAFTNKINKSLHWRQRLSITYLQVQTATFSFHQLTHGLRNNPTGSAIKSYCTRHRIPLKTILVNHTIPTESKVGSGVYAPPPTLHFITPPSATADGPVLLYFHGGGYVNPLRGIAHMPFVLRCAAACKAREVVFLEYALAPEYQYPVQLVQAVSALRYLLKDLLLRAEDIILAGDSAGGHLAGSLLAHMVKTSPYAASLDINGGRFRAVLFVSPWTTMRVDQGSYETNAEKDYINRTGVSWLKGLWIPTEEDVWADLCEGEGAEDVWSQVFPSPKGSPGLVKNAMVTAGTAEVLLDSCRRFARDCVRAQTVAARRETDWSVLGGKDFIFVECEGEVHVQPALDAALRYHDGVMMRAILRWLENV
ncbi:lipase/thioesterase [Histoplasma capsulatum G186AR]|uniref:Lipase/thioesterase n=1 Tax=Ajellomyces capsulatus TaxID=5037 RepID=A0A8H7Z2Z2_AJECA|nr:lipase/thioesterase [Histoplasma capsulatum]QSS67193.1 lipase/thioesterase [Histoplasma capsulatum G186AR]